MITRKQLREIHGGKLPLHILEQDYVQSIFLQELYKDVDTIVFKGGTFLKHGFGLDRFSEDLDFTQHRSDRLKNMFEDTASRMRSYGIEGDLDRIEEDQLSFNARLRYRGPLYNRSGRSYINIEVSKRDDVFLKPEWTRLFFDYPETRVVNVLGLGKEEILAEKLRALSTRSKGRDLYDVWFLIKQNVIPDKQLYERKMRMMDRDPTIDISISEREYLRDLNILLVNPPGYGSIIGYVERKLTEKGFDIVPTI